MTSTSDSMNVVCLMNTRRHGSYAVAGVDTGSESWVRFLGSGPYGGVTEEEQALADGNRPRAFDVLEVPVAGPVLDDVRSDTWRIGPGTWSLRGRIEGADRAALLDRLATEEPVFGTNEASFSLWSLVERGSPSLAVIKPQRLTWIKSVRGNQTRLVAAFPHAGAHQRLPVVDRSLLSEFADAEMGQYTADDRDDTYLIITSEPLGDEYWKIVSGVLALPRDGSASA